MGIAILQGKSGGGSNLDIGTEEIVSFQENIESGNIVSIIQSPLAMFPEIQSYNEPISYSSESINNPLNQFRNRIAISDNGSYVIVSDRINRSTTDAKYYIYTRNINEYIRNEIIGLIPTPVNTGAILIDLKCNFDASIIYVLERRGSSTFTFTLRIYTRDEFNFYRYTQTDSVNLGNFSLTNSNNNLISLTVRNNFICINALSNQPIVYEGSIKRNVVSVNITESNSAYGQTSDDGVVLIYGTPNDSTSNNKLRVFIYNGTTYQNISTIPDVTDSIFNAFLNKDGSKYYTISQKYVIATSSFEYYLGEYDINRNNSTVSLVSKIRIDNFLNLPSNLNTLDYPRIFDFKVSDDGNYVYAFGKLIRKEINATYTLLFDFTTIDEYSRFNSIISNNFTDIISFYSNYNLTNNFTFVPSHYRLSAETIRAYKATGQIAADINRQFFSALGVAVDSGIGENKKVRVLWRN